MKIQTGAQNKYQIGYHMVWGVKYHKYIINKEMRDYLAKIIKEICSSYDYYFYSLGIAPNHVHFFVGAPPKIAPAKIVRTIKSITARQMFKQFPEIKKSLWGGELWKNGYYIGTISEGQTEAIVLEYLKKQEHESKPSLKQLRFIY